MPGVSPVTKSFAASCAARSRVGRTSVASIDSDTSITSITVARLRGTRCSAVGPAIAVVSSISAITSTIAGTCRTQPCRLGDDLLQQLEVGEAHRPLVPHPLHHDVAGDDRRDHDEQQEPPGGGEVAEAQVDIRPPLPRTSAACGRRRNGRCRRSSPSRCAAPGARPRPGAPRPPPSCPVLGRRRAELLAQQGGRVHLALPARLRVGQHDGAHLGQVDVARVEDLDGEQLVPGGQRTQRPLPVDVAEEVGDHHGEPAAAGRAAQLLDGVGEVAAHPLGRARCLGDLADQAAGVREPAAGRDADGLLPGRDDRADPVPAAAGQVRDRGGRGDDEVALLARGGAEVEARRTGRSTSQVSSSRSATVSRMCGTVVRAVTAQSIRRTSSPGW